MPTTPDFAYIPAMKPKHDPHTFAIFIARKLFAELVFDVQALENMPFTMPEVETYLQGITVGGHKVSDEEKLKHQAKAWTWVIDVAEKKEFVLDKTTVCAIQQIVARDEALEVGCFRSGMVGIAGTEYRPPEPDALNDKFQQMLAALPDAGNIRQQAYQVHLSMARSQFFYDGNKRTGLLAMNGLLLQNGYPPLSVPAKWLTEYNGGMIKFYESGDGEAMTAFLERCHARMYERFGLNLPARNTT